MATHSNQPPKTPTPEDLSLLPTCGEISFEIPNVTWPDGSPVELTLRALDAQGRAAVDRAAIAAGTKVGIDYDDATALVETVFQGIVRPTLTEDHRRILWKWNAWILDQLAEEIDRLGRLPARQLQAYLERLAGRAIPEKPERKKATARKRARRPVDQPAGNPPGDTPSGD